MTPAARISAAISVLDAIRDGLAVEQALTRWGRQSRYAGSKDRAAVRDHVFDVLRQRRTAACLGGGEDGRALMIGLLRHRGIAPDSLFNGDGHPPAALTAEESKARREPVPEADRWNLPDWIMPEFKRSLGPKAEDTALALQERAPVTVRVNTRKVSRTEAAQVLSEQGIDSTPNALSETALTLGTGARRLRQTTAYQDGLVELQDAASQAVVALLPPADKCLDYCAGGGGKSLAMAAREGRRIHAHDIDPHRMSDLPNRAARAGADIVCVANRGLHDLAPFDLVLCDVPCSGSGAWRRAPDGKWSLTPDRLKDLCQSQDEILDRAAGLVSPDGWLAYATCSVLTCENEDRIAAFVDRNPDWRCVLTRRFDVSSEGDGFFAAHLTRAHPVN